MNTLYQSALSWANQKHRLYIDGNWLDGGEHFPCLDPTTGTALGDIPVATAAAVDSAVEAAGRAFTGAWGQMSRREKSRRLRAAGQLLRQHREELAAIISLENGKLYREALADDMPDTADIFDYYAGWTDKFYGETAPVAKGFVNYISREPVGVCGLIVPWNFPLLLAMWKLAPALAMGNTAVIKPSEETPLSLLRAFELFAEADIFPHGTINLVLGGGAVGNLIANHPHIDKVSFTGSTATGKKIVTAAGQSNLKTVTLELGGKAPVLLFDDLPDFEAAVERCFQVGFSQKGEKCTEPTRLIIQDALYDRFVAALVEKVNAIRCGNPFGTFAAGPGQGPQCSRAQFDKIMGYIEQGISDGAKLLAGGAADTRGDNRRGYFIQPTVFGDVDNALAIAREEIFGPVMVVQRFDGEAQAVAMANDSQYGLAAGLYTADISRAHRIAAALEAGQIFINRYGCYDFASPFGGFKQSGWGKEMGIHSLDAYTRAKSVWIAYD